jgi:glutaredoxin
MTWLRCLALLAVLVTGLACRSSEPGTQQKQNAAAPRSDELPKLVVKADTPNLLLTWVDDKGDFHVVQKPAEVPASSRKQVRVVVTDKEAGTGDVVYVANLDETTADGAYRLKTMTRAAWDELGASLRKERLEALAPSAAPPPSAAPAGEEASPPGVPKGPKTAGINVVAIIYGASWCKPCHSAQDYLKGRGVTVVMKDIEASEAAQAEMQQKLARVGRAGASIPVIDVMGQILVGYSPGSLDNAIRTAQNAKAL